jgi:hypothetical protein
MLRLTWKRSDVVHRPAEELFEVSMNRLRDFQPLAGAGSLAVSEGPIGTGTTMQWSTPYEDIIVSDSAVVTEFEPSRKISLRYTRSYRRAPDSTSTRRYANIEIFTSTMFEPVPGGTRRTASAQLWISGVRSAWHPLLLLAQGNSYKKYFHKSTDDVLDLVEGPSFRRKAMSFVRQVWSGWVSFWLAFLALLWVHVSHEQLGVYGARLQVVRVAIGLMVVVALLGGYFMASVRGSR